VPYGYCAAAIANVILLASDVFTMRLWRDTGAASSATREKADPDAAVVVGKSSVLDIEEVFREFKEGVAKHIADDDFSAHFELARAYAEMGLVPDALREAAIAIQERAPHATAMRALNWVLDPARAKPEAFALLVSALRCTREGAVAEDSSASDDSVERELLKRGDYFAARGETARAVEQYLAYCEHIERSPDRAASHKQLRFTAVRKQILELLPERRDVRRALVENYVTLGLVDDARRELRRLASEWDAAGDTEERDEVLARLREIS
jgi:hypothetical protein